MWNTILGVALELVKSDLRYTNETESDLLEWIIGAGNEDFRPHQRTSDLLSLYATNLLNSGARGPSREAFGRMVRAGFSDFVRDNQLVEFGEKVFLQKCIEHINQPGDALVADPEANQRYVGQMQSMVAQGELNRRKILPRLLASVRQFCEFLMAEHQGSAKEFHQIFMEEPDSALPNYFPKNQLERISFSQVGIAVGMNFLKDSQVSAFRSNGKQDAARQLENIGRVQAGWLVKPDRHLLRLMFWITGRASLANVSASQLYYLNANSFQALVNQYAGVRSREMSGVDYALCANQPRSRAGLWHCIEDIQRLAVKNSVAPLAIDRLLYLVGSGNYRTPLEGVASDQAHRYERLTSAIPMH